MNKLFLYLITTILLCSCGIPFYCKKFPFDNDDLCWVDVYTESDSVFFESEGRIDTLIVLEKGITDVNGISFPFTECNWAEGQNSLHASAFTDFLLLHGGQSYQGGLSIHKDSLEYPASCTIVFGRRFSYNNDAGKLMRVLFENHICDDCIIVDEKNSHPGYSKDAIVKRIVWSKSKGLLQYTLNGGDTYILKQLKQEDYE